MPSGQTHDRITLYTLPLIAGVTLWQTGSSTLTLLVAGGFMFSGLMFGPDLDIYSRQFQRRGYCRWIWLPYQKSLRHRSFLSHGLIIGTTLRILYLGCGVAMVSIVILLIGWQLNIINLTAQELWQNVRRSLLLYLSDWGNSTYKKVQKQGVKSLLPKKKVKKRRARVKR